MRQWRNVMVLFAVFLLGIGPAFAQDTTCPILAQTALAAADESCSTTGRNQACYGNINLTASPQPGVTSLAMDTVGDIANVADIQTLNLSQMDVDTGQWGVALMRIQANLPDTLPGQNVTFLLFGNVEITNAVDSSAILPTVNVTATSSANLRSGPTTNDAVVGSLAAGDVAVADGRLADNSWLRLQLPDGGGTAWVFAQLMSADGDLATLNVADPADTSAASPYKPMQSFYFRSGVGDSPCAEAPDSGILIQTPQGVGKINLTVNEANIELGSTAFLQAQPGDMMDINLLEGSGTIEADGQMQMIPAGTVVSVPIDENMIVSGPPTEPQPYDITVLGNLPVNNLDAEIVITPPLTPDEIEALTSLEPIPGTWIYTSGAVTLSGCPGMNGSMFPQVTETIEIESGVSFLDTIIANSEELPGGVSIENTAPGVYDMGYSAEGAAIRWQLRVLSPTAIEGESVVTAEGCTITIPFSLAPA